jgi:hypothetical protein
LVLSENSGALEPDGIAIVYCWLEVGGGYSAGPPPVRLLH